MNALQADPVILFESKKGLVFHAIKQMFGSYEKADRIAQKNNMELHDLVQIGLLVLWRLCLKEDPNRADSFNGYVIQSVKWKIRSEFYTKGLPIKITLWTKPEQRNSFSFHSVDSHSGDDSDTQTGFFARAELDTEQEVINRLAIEEALKKLSPEERFVLEKRSLGHSDLEIAQMIGKDRRQTTRIRNRAIKRINPDYEPDGDRIVPVGARKGKRNV